MEKDTTTTLKTKATPKQIGMALNILIIEKLIFSL